MDFRFRPLDGWPDARTPADQRRSRWTFKAGWADTLHKLDYELAHLGAKEAVIEADFTDSDIRLDGLPRANARNPQFPGVRISFDSKHGPLQYATDSYEYWQHNIRAIALGLEALRAVDRYGITAHAEQYRGWIAIEGPAGDGDLRHPTSVLAWLRSERVSGIAGAGGLTLKQLLRQVARNLHPDVGGDPAMWAKFDQAKQVLDEAGYL